MENVTLYRPLDLVFRRPFVLYLSELFVQLCLIAAAFFLWQLTQHIAWGLLVLGTGTITVWRTMQFARGSVELSGACLIIRCGWWQYQEIPISLIHAQVVITQPWLGRLCGWCVVEAVINERRYVSPLIAGKTFCQWAIHERCLLMQSWQFLGWADAGSMD